MSTVNSNEEILLVKVSSVTDPFGKRMVEKISRNSSGQKFIKQYNLDDAQLKAVLESCKNSGIKVIVGSDNQTVVNESPFLSNPNFTGQNMNIYNNVFTNNPQYASYRSTCDARTNGVYQKQNVVQNLPTSYSKDTHESFVDYNSSTFGSCMMGGAYVNGKQGYSSK